MRAIYMLLVLMAVVVGIGAHRWQHKLNEPKLTPAEHIEQTHKDVAVPEEPKVAPKAEPKPTQVKKKHGPNTPRVARPVPRHRPHVDQAPVETLPPQYGRICIFPLNMIPRCYPWPNADANRD